MTEFSFDRSFALVSTMQAIFKESVDQVTEADRIRRPGGVAPAFQNMAAQAVAWSGVAA